MTGTTRAVPSPSTIEISHETARGEVILHVEPAHVIAGHVVVALWNPQGEYTDANSGGQAVVESSHPI